MAKKTATLHETYKGYKIWHRPWLKLRPWRCEIPHATHGSGHGEYGTLAGCKNIIDIGVRHLRNE
jgi:hypothetical protein